MIWIEERRSILDPNRLGGWGEIVKYGCDTPADIALLPEPNPKIVGSSCLVIDPAELWKLGSDSWKKMG
jgi:hypothetical protein